MTEPTPVVPPRFARLLRLTKLGALVGLSLGLGMTLGQVVALFVPHGWSSVAFALSAATLTLIFWHLFAYVFGVLEASKPEAKS